MDDILIEQWRAFRYLFVLYHFAQFNIWNVLFDSQLPCALLIFVINYQLGKGKRRDPRVTFAEGIIGATVAILGMTISVDLLYFFKMFVSISLYIYSLIGWYETFKLSEHQPASMVAPPKVFDRISANSAATIELEDMDVNGDGRTSMNPFNV